MTEDGMDSAQRRLRFGGARLIGDLLQDLRWGVRSLWRAPAILWPAAAVLAVGIGASSAVFSVASTVLFGPLPYPESDRLMVVVLETLRGESEYLDGRMVGELREHVTTLEHLAASRGSPGVTLSTATGVDHVTAHRISADYFRALNVSPIAGRHPNAEDEQGAAVVLSHGLWQRRFDADRGLVGGSVTVDGTPHVVVGVMPREFGSFPPVDLWIVHGLRRGERTGHNVQLIGRLEAGVSPERAAAELQTLLPAVADAAGDDPAEGAESTLALGVRPFQQVVRADSVSVLLLLAAAVALVLVLACVNTGALLLARASTRMREMAMRLALGCTRGRLVRQLLAESLVLAAVGAAGGVLAAHAGVEMLLRLYPGAAAWQARVDAPLLGFMLATAVSAAVFCGLAAAVQAARMEMRRGLRGDSRAVTAPTKLRRLLVAAQVAVCVALMLGAGLLVREVVRLSNTELGFEPRNVLTAKFSAPGDVLRHYERVVEELRNLPGVEAAAVANNLPVERGLNVPIHGPAGGRSVVSVGWRYVTPDYFEALRVPVAGGRTFGPADRAGAPPVAVVNRAFVDSFVAAGSPLGRSVRLYPAIPGLVDEPRSIVGVVGNVRSGGLSRPPAPTVFVPLEQVSAPLQALMHDYYRPNWVVRTAGEPGALLPVVTDLVRRHAPQASLSGFRPLAQVVEGAVGEHRFRAAVLASFSLFGLGLVTVGVYALMHYSAASRRREVGIRIALGATRRQILLAFVRDATLLTAAGASIGLLAGVAATRLQGALLFGVERVDPASLAGAAAVPVVATVLATYAATWRTARLDPAGVLRDDSATG